MSGPLASMQVLPVRQALARLLVGQLPGASLPPGEPLVATAQAEGVVNLLHAAWLREGLPATSPSTAQR